MCVTGLVSVRRGRQTVLHLLDAFSVGQEPSAPEQFRTWPGGGPQVQLVAWASYFGCGSRGGDGLWLYGKVYVHVQHRRIPLLSVSLPKFFFFCGLPSGTPVCSFWLTGALPSPLADSLRRQYLSHYLVTIHRRARYSRQVRQPHAR
jgi:hypothetical protein